MADINRAQATQSLTSRARLSYALGGARATTRRWSPSSVASRQRIGASSWMLQTWLPCDGSSTSGCDTSTRSDATRRWVIEVLSGISLRLEDWRHLDEIMPIGSRDGAERLEEEKLGGLHEHEEAREVHQPGEIGVGEFDPPGGAELVSSLRCVAHDGIIAYDASRPHPAPEHRRGSRAGHAARR